MNVLLYGHTGTLGQSCLSLFESLGWNIYKGNRHDQDDLEDLQFDGVVWAQGANLSKAFVETTDEDWSDIFDANLWFVVRTLRKLLLNKQLSRGARLVVICSVWETIHRSNKSAYIASKAAVSGLVRALASDLASSEVSINCVSPGIVSSVMTSQHLTPKQLDQVRNDTPGGNLVTPSQVAKVASFLVSSDSIGINGQSILVDYGWSRSHNV
jgi:NAD(P)-dependent dehydrogenase (short-subunit alcohol dehydrogenase family)